MPASERLRNTVIELERTKCHLEGSRTWFRCPEKVCGRRASKLYAADAIMCRVCLRLAYPSQRLAGRDRVLQICQSIRQQLGGSASLLEPFPPRPKNMRWSRYMKLWRLSLEAEDRYWSLLSDFVERLGQARCNEGGTWVYPLTAPLTSSPRNRKSLTSVRIASTTTHPAGRH
jgi:hypothetical protein